MTFEIQMDEKFKFEIVNGTIQEAMFVFCLTHLCLRTHKFRIQ